MLNSIRNFTKSIWAKILMGLIIIPFVFWGMGGVFSGGNKNTVAQINDYKISTQEFIDYINSLNLNNEMIRENLENSIIEEILSNLINTKLLLLEMEDLKININDLALSKILKKNINFLDENKKFSRVKYEKYLLTKNLSARSFEEQLRMNEMQKILFNYIGGGTYSPLHLVNEIYNNQNKSISINLFNMKNLYKKKEEISSEDLQKYINENNEKLKTKNITINLAKVDPLTLVSSNDFNQIFFEKIDEIENSILNEISFDEIIKLYNLKKINIKNFNKEKYNRLNDIKISDKNFEKIINTDTIGNIKLIDNGNEYILFVVDKIEMTMPDTTSLNFENKIKEQMINQDKFDLNQSLYKKINTNNFKKTDYTNLAYEKDIKITKLKISNIKDDIFFPKDILKEIYKLSKNDYTIVPDKNNEIYLISIEDIESNFIKKDNNNYKQFYFESGISLKNNIYSSYDKYLSKKYKLKINQQTLDRLKNYFR